VNTAGSQPLRQGKKTKGKKGKITQILEYAAVYALLVFAGAIPLAVLHIISRVLGSLFFLLVPKRRTIAMENLKNAFAGEKSDKELRKIARRSFTSFFLTFFEIKRLHHLFEDSTALQSLKRGSAKDLDTIFQKAKKLHDESGGCIFVTPHIGNWELLPQVSSVIGIPLAVVVRPLDNRYLEKLIYKDRSASGQVIIPKKNALFVLQKTLQQGRSIGMLPDQSTMRGIHVDFFGRTATTTPVPALLSIMYKRPIVVVACCRNTDFSGFEGIVHDPIWPQEYTSEKEEIYRITREMNNKMESVIRKYPEQYLWMHNRWKCYKNKKEMLA
jgi:KDO2-lipid IV(A) lauroyltransferase